MLIRRARGEDLNNVYHHHVYNVYNNYNSRTPTGTAPPPTGASGARARA